MTEFIQKLSDNVRKNFTQDDIIGEDGIPYCSVCGQPHRMSITVSGQVINVACCCECIMKQAQQQEDAEKRQQALFEARRSRQECFADAAYMRMNFTADDSAQSRLSKAARRYADNFSQNSSGLMFTGGVGTGKTFYACCIANAVIERGFTAMVSTMQPLIRALSDFNRADSVIRRVQTVDLLVLDDFGSVSDTSFNSDKQFELIDARYRTGKPIIVTSNLVYSDQNANSVALSRIIDRLNERCAHVNIDGLSRRRRH